ncbi:MAG TPA: cytochrome D1 domain-containing protein [Xanthobacteraceae bacterium]
MKASFISVTAAAAIGAVTTGLFVTGTSATQPERPVAKLDMTGVVYTADEHGNSISAIDLASGKVAIFPVRISPHNVQITADGARLLTVGEPVADAHGHGRMQAAHGAVEAKGRLLVFDAGKFPSDPVASIQVGAHPAHVVVDRAEQRAFVTNSGDNSVAVIDLARRSVVRTVPTGRYPHGLRISPDGREVYIANVEDGNVSVIDTARLAEVARIPVGRAPVQVGFTPDGTRVYVSLRDENSVAIIDTASRTKVGTVAVGRWPIQVHATPDGRFVYVANQGTEAEPADTVSVIEVATGDVVDTVRTGKGAHGVAVSDDGRLVFITNIVDGTVSVIDASSRAVIADFRVGQGPNGVTFRPGGV